MRFRRKKKEKKQEAEMALSSMVDVVFLLLIYFIVTQSPIIENTYMFTQLPGPTPPTPTEPQRPPLIVDVTKIYDDNDKDLGYYKLNGTIMKVEDLKNFFITMIDADPEQNVLVNCGPNARHQKLVKFLDLCAETKVKEMNIINDVSIPFVEDKFIRTEIPSNE